MRHRGEDVGPPFLTGLRMVCLVTCPIGVALSAAAVPFVEALFGSKWLPMAAPLTVLGIWAIARPLQVTVGRLLNSLGAAWLYGRISVRCLLPFAAGTVLAAHLVGIAGVGCVLLAYILVIGVLLMRVVARVAGVPVRAQWRALRPMFLAAAVSWAATRAVAEALHAASPLLALAVCVATCLATYALMLLLADRSVLRTAMQQTRRLVTPKRAAPATRHGDVDQRRGRRRKPIGSMSVLHAMTRRSRP
jgi:O-antigen/teichoic acid export membrane protein